MDSYARKNLFFYFFKLDEQYEGYDIFKDNWLAIGEADFNSKELANIIHKTVAHARRFSPAARSAIRNTISDHLHVWAGAAQRRMEECNPQALANSLWALATLGLRPDQGFMAEWTKAAQRQMEEFNPQNLSNSLWALATLGLRPDQGFMAAWTKAAQHRMEEFNPQALANSLWALATLGLRPDQGFMAAWTKAAQHRMGEFNPQDLSNSLWALATLGLRPDQGFMAEWTKAAQRQMEEFNPQDLSNSLWACAVLDCLSSQGGKETGFREIATLLCNHLPENSAQELREGRKQIHDSALWFDFPVNLKPPVETDIHSKAEIRLKCLFNRHAGEAGGFIPALGHTVDIAWENGRKYLLEVDGYDHFTVATVANGKNSLRLDGGTMLQTALIAKCAPDSVLLRLPLTVGNSLLAMQPPDAGNYITTLAERAQSLSPGRAFFVVSQSNGDGAASTPAFAPVFPDSSPS